MTLTAFPNGVSSFGLPLVGGGGIIPIAQKYFFVCSVTGSNGNEGTDPESPLATIDYAVGLCRASKGDVIIAMPGHVETITAAGSLALDVAGINLIGVGWGSLRPTLNFTTVVGASCLVTAANITMRNFLFTGGLDALTKPLHVQAADFALFDSEYRDVTGQATDFLLTTAAANRMYVNNFRYRGDSAAGANAGIAIVGGSDIVIDGVYADGNFAVGFIDVRTTATTNLEVRNILARTRNSADVILVDTITGSTGTIGPNLFARLQDNAANFAGAFSGATFVYHNLVSIANLAGEIGGINATIQDGFKTASTNA